jgi:hypothetical protein
VSKKTLIEEQKRLLVSENVLKNQAKRLASGRSVNYMVVNGAVASAVAAGSAVAIKLGDVAPLAYAEKLVAATQAFEGEELIVALADIMSAGHAAVEKLAVDGGFLIAEASGGTPKKLVSEVVRLSLNI